MLRIDLLVVGKLKEEYWRRACEEYTKRLGAFAKVQILELPEARVPQNPSEAQIAAALAERSVYREWTFAQQLASQPEADFGMALIDIMQNTALPEAFQKAMMPLTEVLGSTTMEVEKQALIGALMALRQEEKYWTEQENRQGLLFRRLGMLGGLALVVLLI